MKIKKEQSCVALNKDLKTEFLELNELSLSNLVNRALDLFLHDEQFKLLIYGCTTQLNNPKRVSKYKTAEKLKEHQKKVRQRYYKKNRDEMIARVLANYYNKKKTE
jgi:hypothetical protein